MALQVDETSAKERFDGQFVRRVLSLARSLVALIKGACQDALG